MVAVAIAAFGAIPSRASGEDPSIVVNETVTATDTDTVLPPIDLTIDESVSATDGDTVLPPVDLPISEPVGVSDSVTLGISPAPIDEPVDVTDSITISIVDPAPPTSTITFPADGGLYNAAAWNAGCPTVGFCGTSADNSGGSGLATVEVSLRSGSGNWWGGSAFDSASETFICASGLASWSFGFPLSQLPDGAYTLHVRATDKNGNVETPKSATFTIDTTAPNTVIDSGPASVTHDTSATFTFHSTEAGSTFMCKLDAGAYASCTSTKSYTNLGLGAHTFSVKATDAAGNTDPTPASWSWNVHSNTSVLYNGAQIVTIGSTFRPAALLSSAASACRAAQPIAFALDRSPTGGAAGSYALPGSNTDSSGQATSASVSTSGWLEGVYTVAASYAGSASCDASTDSATLTVASAGDAASGGGWYTLSGSGRVNFGFTVKKQSDGSYRGQFLLINNGKWRLKGTLTSYVKTGSQGAVGGSGDLFYWDQTANGGLGAWVLSQTNTTFTASFADKGSVSKSTSDTFGVHIDHVVRSPEPATLPNSSPIAIKGGDVRVS
jgi:hypothetical protein